MQAELNRSKDKSKKADSERKKLQDSVEKYEKEAKDLKKQLKDSDKKYSVQIKQVNLSLDKSKKDKDNLRKSSDFFKLRVQELIEENDNLKKQEKHYKSKDAKAADESKLSSNNCNTLF